MDPAPPGPPGVTGGPIKTLYDGTVSLSKIEGLSLPAPSRPPSPVRPRLHARSPP
ncbi:hypothetical protein GCM10009527_070580 [Actinomadura nitritigenes]